MNAAMQLPLTMPVPMRAAPLGRDAGLVLGAWPGSAAAGQKGLTPPCAIVLMVAAKGAEGTPDVKAPRLGSPATSPANGPMSGAAPKRSEEEKAELEAARELQRDEERKLCEQAKGGNRQALAQLLRRHGPTLYRTVLLPRLGSEAAAQDALADTYMRVLERFDQFEWRGCGVYPWLRVIAMRIALDALRSRKRETLFEPADLTRAVEAAERDLEDGLDAQICERRDRDAGRERLDRALATINDRYARAIRLRVLEEKSREAAAEALGVTVPTFDVVLHRALASLKKALRAQEPAGEEAEP
jgi:RNA polymerase sigma factor (sigma-70 family)